MNGGAPLFQLSLLRVLIQREAGQNRSYHAGTEVNPLEWKRAIVADLETSEAFALSLG